MKRFLMSSIAGGMALSLLAAPLAIAGQDQHGGQPGQHAQDHAGGTPHAAAPQGAAPQGMQHDAMQHETVSHPTMPAAHSENHAGPAPHAAGHGGGQHWRSGQHFTGNRNYVSNWNRYHLRQPPAGYQWVQDGSEFVLVAVATGIISDVILNAGD